MYIYLFMLFKRNMYLRNSNCFMYSVVSVKKINIEFCFFDFFILSATHLGKNSIVSTTPSIHEACSIYLLQKGK